MGDRSKGQSLIEIPNNCVVIDIETTGFSPEYDEIIEVAALRIENSIPTESFASLIRPKRRIPDAVVAKTGITDEMVSDAPSIEDVLPGYIDFIGSAVLVGHNVGFDINFLYDNAQRVGLGPVSNDHVNTMRLATRLLPDLKERKLDALAEALGVTATNRHRALGDCQTTADCLMRLREVANELGGIPTPQHTWHGYQKVNAHDITPETTDFDPDSPIFGRTFVFTGELKSYTRAEAMQKVVNAGGIVGNGVTRATNYLVVGNTDYFAAINGGKTSKMKKAEDLALKGQDISIIPEDVFLDMLTESGSMSEEAVK